MSEKNLTFGQRFADQPTKFPIQMEEMSSQFKTDIHNFFSLKIGQYSIGGYLFFIQDFFHENIDGYIDDFNSRIVDRIRIFILHTNTKWWQVYDLLEFYLKRCGDDDKYESACNEINRIMEQNHSAYRINKETGLFIKFTEIEQITAIEEVQKTPHEIVRAHINKSVALLSDRQKPDYENSIKESISAVEAACRIILQDDSIVLSDALKQLKDKIKMHPALNEGFQKIYGYTSDAGGVRHSKKSDSTPATHAEAQFMLVACSAFISYLFASDKKQLTE